MFAGMENQLRNRVRFGKWRTAPVSPLSANRNHL
jgi:hypothetical protein